MKRAKSAVLIFILIVVGIIIWFLFLRKKEVPVILVTEQAKTGYIAETVTATGTVQPVDTTTVGSRISATIEEVYADFNSTVKKGQLLAVLDASLFQASVNQIRASLAEAESNQAYQAGNYSRQHHLYEVGAISKADYDLSLNSYTVAKATIASVKAQLYSAERNLSFTRIYSPVDGVVLSRNVSVGQTVAASFSTPTLFVIAKDITRMQVEGNVDEADIGRVSNGLRTTFTVDAYVDDVFKGQVKEIRLQPTVSSNVVTYTTIVDAPNNDKKLKPGMTASIIIYAREMDSAVLIPAKALKYTPDAAVSKTYLVNNNQINSEKTVAGYGYVWVKHGNELSLRQVKTGINNNSQVQILEGLSAGDEIVTGSETAGAGAVPSPNASSPFMPKPPGGDKKSK